MGPQGPQGEQGPPGPPDGFGAPNYDSGWVALSPGSSINLMHNLGTQNLFVYMIGRDPGGWVHQDHYGLEFYGDLMLGARWLLSSNNNMIQIVRGAQDTQWTEVRVYIWILP